MGLAFLIVSPPPPPESSFPRQAPFGGPAQSPLSEFHSGPPDNCSPLTQTHCRLPVRIGRRSLRQQRFFPMYVMAPRNGFVAHPVLITFPPQCRPVQPCLKICFVPYLSPNGLPFPRFSFQFPMAVSVLYKAAVFYTTRFWFV